MSCHRPLIGPKGNLESRGSNCRSHFTELSFSDIIPLSANDWRSVPQNTPFEAFVQRPLVDLGTALPDVR